MGYTNTEILFPKGQHLNIKNFHQKDPVYISDMKRGCDAVENINITLHCCLSNEQEQEGERKCKYIFSIYS